MNPMQNIISKYSFKKLIPKLHLISNISSLITERVKDLAKL